MDIEDRNANPTSALTVWTTLLNRLLERTARDYWAHAEALWRCVDDIARARTLASYDEARRTYWQRVLTLFEQSASEYASLWEIEQRPRVDPKKGRSHKETTASADGVHDAPPPIVQGAATGNEIAVGSPAAVAEARQRLTDSARATAATDAMLDEVRAKAAAAADISATPSKKRRARKARPKIAKDMVAAAAPQKPPRKRPRQASKDVPSGG